MNVQMIHACTPNIRNSSTRSHASEGENRSINRVRSVNGPLVNIMK